MKIGWKRWNAMLMKQLRKVRIFKRLSLSFLFLSVGSTMILAFFTFYLYAGELAHQVERQASLMAQNNQLRVQDILNEYEKIPRQFYEDRVVVAALTRDVQNLEARKSRNPLNSLPLLKELKNSKNRQQPDNPKVEGAKSLVGEQRQPFGRLDWESTSTSTNTHFEGKNPSRFLRQVHSDNSKVATTERRLIEQKLYHMARGQRYVKNIQLITPQTQYHMREEKGFQRGGTVRNLPEFYQSPYYQEAIRSRGYPVWTETDKQNPFFYESEQSIYGLADILTLSVAIYEPKTRDLLGVLILNVDLAALEGAARGERGESDRREGNLFLVGQQGTLLGFHPSLAYPSPPSESAFYPQMERGPRAQGVFRKKTEGRSILVAYEKIPSTSIFSVYIADMDFLMRRARSILWLCLLLLFLTVLACVGISFAVTKSIVSPIRRLIVVMERMGHGEWRERFRNEGQDEITILGEGFNEMAERMKDLVEQVYLSEIKRQQLQLHYKNAQLDAIMMQINPHFLYNTLDIIRWEALYEANGESRVSRMIEAFSRLCRMGMRLSTNTVPLQTCLEHVEAYLRVVNFARSQEQEKIQWIQELEERAETCYVPQFLLQPLVENAVLHAFPRVRLGDSIRIEGKICAAVSGAEEILQIEVIDNGVGMMADEVEALRVKLNSSGKEAASGVPLESAPSTGAPPDSQFPEKPAPQRTFSTASAPSSTASAPSGTDRVPVGMVNVQQRIRLYYGEAYGITVESRVGEGTRVQIVLPVRTQEEKIENLGTGGGRDGLPSFIGR